MNLKHFCVAKLYYFGPSGEPLQFYVKAYNKVFCFEKKLQTRTILGKRAFSESIHYC